MRFAFGDAFDFGRVQAVELVLVIFLLFVNPSPAFQQLNWLQVLSNR
jgi:hypothetical protein